MGEVDERRIYHAGKIFLLSMLIVAPMIAFTAVLLWLIFGHLINNRDCPNPDLCQPRSERNYTFGKGDYLVDLPAARLVFIASWSSTVSFTLVGVMMSIYSYVVARQWLHLSHSGISDALPTPYQTNTLFRVLNSELPSLVIAIRDMFRKSKREKTPPLLRSSVAIFASGIMIRCVA